MIATRNRRDELVAHLDHHEGPVIVVDNASTDGTVADVRGTHPQVRIVALPRNLGAAARTAGAQLATTPYVAFADDDSWWAPGALARAAAVFDSHPRLGLLAGSIVVGREERPDPLNAVLDASPLGVPADGPGPALLGFVGCGAIVRRSAFLEVGGFDAVVRFPGEEDRVAIDLFDAGWSLCYVPEVRAHHHPSTRREATDRRQADLVRSRLLTALLRRSARATARELIGAARSGRRGWRGMLGAVPRVPAALRSRRRITPRTEAALELLRDGPAPDETPADGASAHDGARAPVSAGSDRSRPTAVASPPPALP